MNSKGKKQIGITVDENYPFGGAEVRKEIDALFQYIYDNNPDLIEAYPKFNKIKEMLSQW